MKAKRPLFSFTLPILAVWFLFQPNISTLDILPDWIAYGMLYLSLQRISAVIPHFSEAQSRFGKLFWINLSKLPVWLLVTGISGANSSESSIVAVASLGYAVLEAIFLFPAFTQFFDGLDYLEARYGEDGAPAPAAPRTVTYLFFAVKLAASTLPDFVLISVADTLGNVTANATQIKAFRPHFTVLAVLISLIFGILWLAKLLPYLRALKRNTALQAVLASLHEEKGELLQRQSTRTAITLRAFLFFLAAVLSFDLMLEHQDAIPNALSTLVLLLLLWSLHSSVRYAPVVYGVGFLTLAADLLTHWNHYHFFSTFTLEDIYKLRTAKNCYDLMLLSKVTEAGLTVLFLFLLARLFARYLAQSIPAKNNFSTAQSYHKQLECALQKKCLLLAFFLSLVTVSSVIYFLLLSYTEKVLMRPESGVSTATIATYGWFWIVPAVTSILAIAYAYSLFCYIREETDYALEG